MCYFALCLNNREVSDSYFAVLSLKLTSFLLRQSLGCIRISLSSLYPGCIGILPSILYPGCISFLLSGLYPRCIGISLSGLYPGWIRIVILPAALCSKLPVWCKLIGNLYARRWRTIKPEI